MLRLIGLIGLLFCSHSAFSQKVTIIESQSGDPWAYQDTVWRNVVQDMGLFPEIVPQNTLSSVNNLHNTILLIISSGTIELPAEYLETVEEFVLSGGPTYVQAEYKISKYGAVTFDSLMSLVGADFKWNSTIEGDLSPMKVTGEMASYPNEVSELDYFFYGLSGEGNGVEAFLEYEGNNFGFCYVDSNHLNGPVISISDEDWIVNNSSPALMENILTKLLTYVTVKTKELDVLDGVSLYPNPTKGFLTIDFAEKLVSPNLQLYDINGKLVIEKNYNKVQKVQMHLDLDPGLYTIHLRENGKLKAMKFIMQ